MTRYRFFNKSRLLLLLLLFLFLPCQHATAHGVAHSMSTEKAVLLQAAYSDGSPMSFAEVVIFSPSDSEVEHQNGRTDKNGRFAFFPDEQGEWSVSVTDGMGHAFTRQIRIDNPSDLSLLAPQSQNTPGTPIAIAGVVMGLLGIASYLRARAHASKGEK
ncbi:hypothetical protein [Prosthecochloris sp. HL-130-GSB]|jgi:nickel transport protein|nr:hypothetical protein [Prosthecochloris sp. HL-130-GSB]ARM31316.1 hypothetical protein B9H02_08445 [Prosthecochloris sp. HL-130-GSB]